MSIAISSARGLRPTRYAAVAVGAAVLVSGCTAGSSSSSGGSGGNGGGGGGGGGETLLVNTSFVYSTLDPARAYEQTGYLTIHSLCDTLMTFDGGNVGEPLPELAEGFEVSEDGTTYTFTLRDDAVFSDGSPVTSEDVLFSLNRMMNVKGSGSAFFEGLEFSAPDESTVVVTADRPTAEVPTLMAMPVTSILNQEVATANGATDAEDAETADTAQTFLDSTSACAGPYVLERNDPGNEIVLTANEEYWGEAPGYSRVVIRNADAQNQKLAISRSQGDEIALDVTGNLLDGLPESVNVSQVEDTLYMLYMSTDPAISPATSNPDWRAALRSSLDYEGLAGLYGQGGDRLGGFLANAYPGSLPVEEGPERDLDAARASLEASGVGDEPVRFIYPSITYRGVDLGTVATKIQGDAAEAGINLELTPLALPAFLEEQRGGSVVMGLTPHALIYPRPESLVRQLSPGGVNAERVRWSDGPAAEEVTAAAERVLTAVDGTELESALVDWQQAMRDGSPYLPVAQNSGSVVSTEDVADAEYTPAGWILDLAAVEPA
ncbi:ABC transporter substrate-binding protein [Blastococcus sp. VKM Ac-2987]|uniref:ABC transporter substrate-binding protein n=1 Tax=Blastococcus sp. VKM Ac-2987 TaxID=3004141 RepID=UPI0022AB9756|nr:ABC transporter substrate-binding protein [Blastococcus sp. VKM Ac-2987]MCZ2857576.1 ABC transporter substrate-binding protein [Blastococcus sp. VKM Ac-2987]